MIRSATKCESDSDIINRGDEISFVSSRHKRRRDSITRDDFEAFKEEIRNLFASLKNKMDSSLEGIERSFEVISLQHDEFRTKIKKLEKDSIDNTKIITSLQEKL